MKLVRVSLLVVGCALLLNLRGAARADVEPASLSITNLRAATSIAWASQASFWQGDTLMLSNCVMFAGAGTNSARQDLTTVAISVKYGNSTTNISCTGYPIVATAGTWWCSGSLPSNAIPCYLQVTITSNGSYTYEHQQINTRQKL